MRWEDLPEELGPFEKHIADVENLKDPDPVGIAEMEVFHDAGSLRVSNVASIEVRKDVKETHDRQHLLVELQSVVSEDYKRRSRLVLYLATNASLNILSYWHHVRLHLGLSRLHVLYGLGLWLALFDVRHCQAV